MDGLESSHVFEYVYKPYKRDAAKPDDAKELAFLYLDDPKADNRVYVRAQANYDASTPVSLSGSGINSHSFKTEDLQAVVHKALKDRETTATLVEETKDNANLKVYGFVDLSVNRVYMMKIVLWSKYLANIHVEYLLVPEYGECKEERPPQPIVDNTTLPEIKEVDYKEPPQDDDFDDKPPVTAAAPAASGAAPAGGVVATIDPKLEETLISLNNNLGRMADTFEKILAVLAAKFENK